MREWWTVLAVILYPIALAGVGYFVWRLDRLSALASGLITFLFLWLYALPRDLAWTFGPIAWESRFAMPLTAYLCGLVVTAVLMSWTRKLPA
jgi:hypothetical protein